MDTIIDSFSGGFRFLSNFYYANVTYDGVIYASVEHAYQAAKTADPDVRKVMRAMKCAEVKKFGSTVHLIPDWEFKKMGIMSHLVRDKFFNHDDLGTKLLSTGNAKLIEGNTWGDRFWGVCKGQGENHLGKILMQVRTEVMRRRDP